ncbi:hypothetical protein ACTXT7_009386 [Hymenolepis weldensis]
MANTANCVVSLRANPQLEEILAEAIKSETVSVRRKEGNVFILSTKLMLMCNRENGLPVFLQNAEFQSVNLNADDCIESLQRRKREKNSTYSTLNIESSMP